MAVLLRNLLDRHVEAVLLEDAGLVGKRQRRKTGPSRDTDGDFHVLRDSWRGHQERGGRGEYFISTHDDLPSAGFIGWILNRLLLKLCRTRLALASLSASLEAGDQFVGLTGIDQAHGG